MNFALCVSGRPPKPERYASIAQLVEHLTLNQGVRGSSPRGCTIRNPAIPSIAGFSYPSYICCSAESTPEAHKATFASKCSACVPDLQFYEEGRNKCVPLLKIFDR